MSPEDPFLTTGAMNLNDFRSLLSPTGQQTLDAASDLKPKEVDFLRHFTTLSRQYPSGLARSALEIAILRIEAQDKFPHGEQLFYTRPALEQSSSYMVSKYRAARFQGFDLLLDLGCSIGSDTISLAEIAPTIGIDLDPLRLSMAQANMQALGLQDRVSLICADLISSIPLSPTLQYPRSLGLFFDPARRSAGKRLFSVHDYLPPLTLVKDWLLRYPALAVKISPGVKLDQLRDYDAEIEFISLKGELKEAVLWFGPLKTAHWRATVLPGPHTFVSPLVPTGEESHPHELERRFERIIPLDEPRAYLYEPDPSILRAGLVQALGATFNAAQLDPDISYLTSDLFVETPFARSWPVETWFPFGVKRLRAALRERGVERVVVKKRGSPIQPEDLIQELRLKKERQPEQAERVIFLTHLRGKPIVVLCFP